MPLDQRARQSAKSIIGRAGAGFARLGVSGGGCGFVVCASRLLRGAKKHRTAALFRVSVAIHLPARVAIVGLICAMASAALPASDRRNSTSVISCLARGGCWVVIKKKVSFCFATQAREVLFLFRFLEQNFTLPRRPMNIKPEGNSALEKWRNWLEPNARRMECDCEGASEMMVTLACDGC